MDTTTPDAAADAAANDMVSEPGSAEAGALQPGEANDAPSLAQPTLKLRLMHESSFNYRENFDEQAMDDLRRSIATQGRIEIPLIVRVSPTSHGMYEIVAGARRYRAGLDVLGEDYEAPVSLRELDDEQASVLQVIENRDREDPSVIEEARAARRLLQITGGNRQATATMLGMRLNELNHHLMLLHCSASVQQAVVERKLPVEFAEMLSALPEAAQEMVLPHALAGKFTPASLRKLIQEKAHKLSQAVFDTTPCATCKHNSALQTALFAEGIGDGYCLNPQHYIELSEQHAQAQAAPLKEKYATVRFYRMGEGFEPLIVAQDGAAAVGHEQFAACQGCGDYGAAVSMVAGSYGQATEGHCFNSTCHVGKVSAHRARLRAAERQAQAAKPEAAGASSSTAAGKPAGAAKQPELKAEPGVGAAKEAPAKASKLPGDFVKHREQMHRAMLRQVVTSDPQKSRVALAAMACSGLIAPLLGSDVTEHAAAAGLVDDSSDAQSKHWPGNGNGKALTMLMSRFAELSDERIDRAPSMILAAYAGKQPIEIVQRLLTFFEADEREHLTFDEHLLATVPVATIKAYAEEVGIDKAVVAAGKKWSAVCALKRPEFVKAVLSVAGFKYLGAVPADMRYERLGRKAKAKSE